MEFFEPFSEEIITSTKKGIGIIVAKLNDKIRAGERVTVNDFLAEFDIQAIYVGDMYGWDKNRMIFVSAFRRIIKNGVECLEMKYVILPKPFEEE